MTDSGTRGEYPRIGVDFRSIFDTQASYVWNSLRRLGVPDADRDDVAQEVFVTVHALLDDYDPSRPLRPWLFAIAYRIVLRHRRKQGRNREEPSEVPDAPAAGHDPERALDARETQVLVHAAVEAIEIHRRAVFVMKEIDGVDVPDIADSLGIPLNTAYSRLRLAREDFRVAVQRLRIARPAMRSAVDVPKHEEEGLP